MNNKDNWFLDASKILNNLTNLGGKLQLDLRIEEPCSDSAVASVESKIGYELPTSIRRLATEITGEAILSFLWEPPKKVLPVLRELFDNPRTTYFWGGAHTAFSLNQIPQFSKDCLEFANESWLADDEFKTDQQFWLNSTPFLRMSDGDYLGIDRENGVSVNYLSHDDESYTCFESLEDFLDWWRVVNFLGPGYGSGPFFDYETKKYLNPTTAQKSLLGKLFGIANA